MMPRIPREEYPVRWERAKQILKDMDLDLILAYSDDRFTYGNAHARYFGDLQTVFEDTVVMLLPDREPVLLVGPETIGYAQERSVFTDIRVIREFTHEDEDYPYTVIEPLTQVVAEKITTPVKRIGLAAKGRMGAVMFEAICKAFPGVEFVNVDKPLEEMRGIKSEAEIAVIRYAYEIVNKGMEAALAAVRPGVTERQVAAEAEYVMRKMGAEGTGIDTIVASGPNANHILARTTNRVIEETGFVPNEVARTLFRKSAKTIGLIVPSIRNPYFTELAAHIDTMSLQHGYRPFLCNTGMTIIPTYSPSPGSSGTSLDNRDFVNKNRSKSAFFNEKSRAMARVGINQFALPVAEQAN